MLDGADTVEAELALKRDGGRRVRDITLDRRESRAHKTLLIRAITQETCRDDEFVRLFLDNYFKI